MVKSFFSSQSFSNFLVNYADVIVDNLKWIVPTVAGLCIGLHTINTYADHDAMNHGYERHTKAGPFETTVKKLPKG